MATDTQVSARAATRWITELDTAEKELRRFWTRGRRIVKKYLDDMDEPGGLTQVVQPDKYNVFWSNIGVLRSALYANPPKPLVKREFDDYQDDVARVAGIMMERLLTQSFEKPESDMNTAFINTVEDRLIPGLGQVWMRYEPVIEEVEVTPETVDEEGKTVEAVTSEHITDEYACTDYVYWEDFWWSPCRTWEECRWVARRVWMDKQEFTERFGKKCAAQVTWTKKPPTKYGDRVVPESMGVQKTEVFEIWCKTSKTVHWISRSCSEELDTQPDPLELTDFWPCPKPLLSTHTTSSMIPKADYLLVQTQYRRLDNLCMRIGMLERAIQASGVYDKQNKELSQILSGNRNKMIPVDNWAAFAEKGGMKGVVDWFPLDMIVNALEKLMTQFQDAKAQLYELTGISDIMRGDTNPRETLGAQNLKAQYSSVRLQYLQGEVALFVQGALKIKSEIISKHFQPETIIKNSLIEYTPDAELAPQAVKLLKDDWSVCYRITVAADTLAIPDYNAERAGRVEFITAAGQFISQVTQMAQLVPEAGPFLLQILQWGVASFRSAATIEGVFDKAIFALNEAAKQPKQPPPPDPAMIKAQAEVKALAAKTQIEAQADQAQSQADVQATRAQTQVDVQATRAKTAADVRATEAKTAADVRATKAKTAAQIQASRAKNAQALAQARRKGNGA